MVVIKSLNSSAVLVKDEKENHYILFGKGIGYGTKVGTEINENNADRTFMPVESPKGREILELINSISPEYVEVTQQIIEKAEKELKSKLNPSIYFTLMDHLHFTVERHKKNMVVMNRVFWEIKNYYPEEFEIGVFGVNRMNEAFNIILPKEEAANIAFHIFIARKENVQPSDGMKYTKMVGSIINLTRYSMNINLDSNSIHYQRFVVHVKFFVERFFQNKMLNDDKQLFNQIATLYPHCMEGAFKIREYIQTVHKVEIPEEELAYLAVHINRLVMKDDFIE
jgi:beta-glucoside operon transcriptional antiterminator